MRSNFFILIIACFSFFSCKKDRTCSCTVSTRGTTTTRNQTAGITLPIPGLPPIEIMPGQDTTIYTPFTYTDTDIASYKKVSKNTMNENCPTTSEESFNDSYVVITPGTSTVSINNHGKKTYACEIK